MSSILKLSGLLSAVPAVGGGSGDPDFLDLFDERLVLAQKHYTEMSLGSDGATSVSLGGLSGANVLMLKVPGGKVVARLTSADGTTQAIPVEEFLVLVSITTPITAIDLARVAGVATTVKVFLGQRQ